MSLKEITAKESGERIDALLARCGYTRSAAVRMIETGRVTRGGEAVKKSERTRAGDVYLVEEPEEAAPSAAEPQDIPLEVVYEDSDVIVVNKPRGLVVHPAPGHPDGTLVNALLYRCGDSLSGVGGELRPGIVHRLDRDTSGLIIAAKNDAAHLALSAQLSDHSLPICPCRRSWPTEAFRAFMRQWSTAPSGTTPEQWTLRSAAIRQTESAWPSRTGTPGRPSRTGRSSPATAALPTYAVCWRPGAPTRSACIWRI